MLGEIVIIYYKHIDIINRSIIEDDHHLLGEKSIHKGEEKEENKDLIKGVNEEKNLNKRENGEVIEKIDSGKITADIDNNYYTIVSNK